MIYQRSFFIYFPNKMIYQYFQIKNIPIQNYISR